MARDELDLGTLTAAIEKEGAPWAAGDTGVSALPTEERLLRLGYEPGPGERPLEVREQLAAAHAAAGVGSAEAIGAPAAYDLHDLNGANFVKPVRDQAACGACVAFGTLAAAEGTMRVARGDADLAVDLSEAHLFYCVARAQQRRCNNGWWVGPALDALRDVGAPDEACYPYVAGDQDCNGRCSDWQARAIKIIGWHEIQAPEEMKAWISTRGPLVAVFSVFEDFYHYTGGIYRQLAGNRLGGHCVCAVGYDDASQYWICKNSWGTNWGERGYFKIGYGQVGIDASMWAIDGFPATGRTRHERKLVRGVWASVDQRNAAVFLDGVGWLKIARTSDSAFVVLLGQLLAAKAAGRRVTVAESGGFIDEVYVL